MNHRIFALAFAALPAAAAADYLGTLKVPSSTLAPTGLYSFATGPLAGLPTTLSNEGGYRLKLGYKYSRYFAVEGEFSDFLRPADVFANPASLASAFRSTGFAVDTVATLPIWGFSFYGRMGAYRGDRMFAGQPALWPGDTARHGTRWRYGLGVRYDFTKSLGIRAQVERYSSLGLGAPFAGDGDTDQVSVGLSWRF